MQLSKGRVALPAVDKAEPPRLQAVSMHDANPCRLIGAYYCQPGHMDGSWHGHPPDRLSPVSLWWAFVSSQWNVCKRSISSKAGASVGAGYIEIGVHFGNCMQDR